MEQWRGPKLPGPAYAGIGRLRKIALLGSAPSLRFTPWSDPSWELWAHASCRNMCRRKPDLLWDLHPPELWRDKTKKTWDPGYFKWLQRNAIPIMMQRKYQDVPASVKYPFEQMVTEFPRGYMTNHVAYMIALALMQGVTHISIFGCDYKAESEYGPQRGSAEYWIGVAEGRGVHVGIPPTCDLCARPWPLYGYESHPDGVRHPAYRFSVDGMKKNESVVVQNGKLTLKALDDPTVAPRRDIGVEPDERFAKGLPASFLQKE